MVAFLCIAIWWDFIKYKKKLHIEYGESYLYFYKYYIDFLNFVIILKIRLEDEKLKIKKVMKNSKIKVRLKVKILWP